MARETSIRARTLGGLIGLLLSGTPAFAQTYEISWWTVDAGGFNGATTSPPGRSFYTTAGQPDAGGPFPGATFAVRSGYWAFVADGGGGQQADLSVTVTDGQATEIPGTPVTYTMTVSNAGPHGASGVWVVHVIGPLSLQNANWTCSASPGSSCPPSGTQSPGHFVDLAIGGVLTYTLTGTIPTPTTGNLVSTISATVPLGVTDPNLANNSATDTDVLTPQVDLALSISDAPDPVGPGLTYAYTLAVRNVGPSYSLGSTVTDTLPSGVIYNGADWPPGGGCNHASGTVTCDLPFMDAGEEQTIRIRALLQPATTGTLTNSATVAGGEADPVSANNSDVETTTVGLRAQAELTHGARITTDLAAVGGAPDADFYRLREDPYSSYEVALDAASGDIGNGGPFLSLLAADGLTDVAFSYPTGTGSSRTMRWMNDTSSTIDSHYVRVRSTGCQFTCGADDQYRLRMWDTTGVIPRFNNSGSQVTVVMVHNPTPALVRMRVYYWDPSGVLLLRDVADLPPRTLYSLNTSVYEELAGMGGSITIASDAPFGTLVGKAVALELTTGFSFDSPMTTRPR